MEKVRKRVFEIIQIGYKHDLPSRAFDIFIVLVIVINLFIVFFETFDESLPFLPILSVIETVTVIIFTIEYILRLWTAKYLYPHKKKWQAVLLFVFSISGIVDLLTFFPFYLPFMFPSGMVAFRMFRVVRIFKLFKINSQYDAYNVILDVLKEKKNQLFFSMCMIFIMMMASSLCMYSVENAAQPENFQNAFSGIWWSMSTLLTVGYGDIYPVTLLGKALAIVIAFLGVGMVAIPTGIISAGFVEQYSKVKSMALVSEERDIHFISVTVDASHSWSGKKLSTIVLPPQIIVALIIRGNEQIIPNGSTVINPKDKLIIGAKAFDEEKEVNLREIEIKEENPWVGKKISELDLSRQELILGINRHGKVIFPSGKTEIRIGDLIIIFKKGAKLK